MINVKQYFNRHFPTLPLFAGRNFAVKEREGALSKRTKRQAKRSSLFSPLFYKH